MAKLTLMIERLATVATHTSPPAPNFPSAARDFPEVTASPHPRSRSLIADTALVLSPALDTTRVCMALEITDVKGALDVATSALQRVIDRVKIPGTLPSTPSETYETYETIASIALLMQQFSEAGIIFLSTADMILGACDAGTIDEVNRKKLKAASLCVSSGEAFAKALNPNYSAESYLKAAGIWQELSMWPEAASAFSNAGAAFSYAQKHTSSAACFKEAGAHYAKCKYGHRDAVNACIRARLETAKSPDTADHA